MWRECCASCHLLRSDKALLASRRHALTVPETRRSQACASGVDACDVEEASGSGRRGPGEAKQTPEGEGETPRGGEQAVPPRSGTLHRSADVIIAASARIEASGRHGGEGEEGEVIYRAILPLIFDRKYMKGVQLAFALWIYDRYGGLLHPGI